MCCCNSVIYLLQYYKGLKLSYILYLLAMHSWWSLITGCYSVLLLYLSLVQKRNLEVPFSWYIIYITDGMRECVHLLPFVPANESFFLLLFINATAFVDYINAHWPSLYYFRSYIQNPYTDKNIRMLWNYVTELNNTLIKRVV